MSEVKLEAHMHSSTSKKPESKMARHAASPVSARSPMKSIRGNTGC